jgi:large subunit ribosomal protein L3
MIGIKKGMTQVFDEQGIMHGVTVVEAGPCQVTQVKTAEKEGYKAVQLQLGKKKREFRVEKPEEYQVGQEIKVDIFKPGDVVRVTGKSIGKGFQGNIKRYHHHRGPMSHGSKSHRLVRYHARPRLEGAEDAGPDGWRTSDPEKFNGHPGHSRKKPDPAPRSGPGS